MVKCSINVGMIITIIIVIATLSIFGKQSLLEGPSFPSFSPD